MWNLKKLNLEKQGRLVVARGWGWRKGRDLGQGCKGSVIRCISYRDLMYSITAILIMYYILEIC